MDQPLPVLGLDPSSVATLAEFAACLNGLRKRRDLSYEAMEAASREMLTRRGGDQWQLLSKSTVGEIVNGERLPSRDRLLTFLAVCGLTPADQVQWIAAWERVSALGAATGTDLALPRHVIALIEDKTREFVGRDYVFDSITDFIDNNTSGYFVLEGDPGTGKSAVLAEYVKRHGCVAHFNQRAEGITDFRQFLESIFAQLRARYKLPSQSMPPDAVGDGAFLSQLLQEAASKLSGGQRLVIAVDALNEVDLAVSRSGANILYLPSILPDGVYFVMTKRHLDIPLTVAARRASYSLSRTGRVQSGTSRSTSGQPFSVRTLGNGLAPGGSPTMNSWRRWWTAARAISCTCATFFPRSDRASTTTWRSVSSPRACKDITMTIGGAWACSPVRCRA